jgi:iron complex outermembrane receptor protein
MPANLASSSATTRVAKWGLPALFVGLICAAVSCVLPGNAAAQVSEEEELAQAYGDKSFVTIATGSRVPVTRAPAVATVITAEDIKASGASDLDEVLETVPGLHVARSTQGNLPVYVIRGVHRDTNPQVLMLMNGIPVTTVFQGNRGNIWGGLPLENVARIEVIRGPGSALYGAEAFTGVINITTKSAMDIDGTQFGARAGSFGSADAWALHGGSFGAVEVAAYLRVGTTAGAKRTITADAATPFGPGISRAPGPMNNERDSIDGMLDFTYEQWQLRIGYKERDHVGSGSGVASALDPTGNNRSERLTSDLTYRNTSFARNWDISVQGSHMRYTEFSDLVLFPPGTNLGGGAFVDGMIGNPYKWERHLRFSASAFYTGFERHRIRFGAGATRNEIYRIRETKNFNPNFSRIGTGSIADVVDVSDTAPFLRPHSRQGRFWFVQDEWNFDKDWTLTAGLRRDQYSDVGQTTNPRLALVWEAAYNLTAKLLYGTAFRAPSFVELYNINNPVAVGTPTLTPEKMKTVEAALSWQATPKLQLGINIFNYQMRDIIQLVGTTYQNTGLQTGTGLEFEAAWDATREWRFAGNYSHQKSIDESTRLDAGLAPHHRIHLRADWRFAPGWAANAQVNAVGQRWRAPGDARPNLSGYGTVDLTVRTDHGAKGWDFAASLRNLFDADAREPSPVGTIPNDFPLPGRSLSLQATHRL